MKMALYILIVFAIGFAAGSIVAQGRRVQETCSGIERTPNVEVTLYTPDGSVAFGSDEEPNYPPASRPFEINMDALIVAESGGNPRAVSPAGARGLCQLMKPTWDECCRRMGVAWSFERDAFDPERNRLVGTFYANTRIPQMLRHYHLPDTVETRLAAYNAGIGQLREWWLAHGRTWQRNAFDETQAYIRNYYKAQRTRCSH